MSRNIIDCGIRTGNSKTAFNTLKLLTQRQQTKTNLFENAKGKLLTEDKTMQKRWTEYYVELYNYKLKTDVSTLKSEDDVENRDTRDSPVVTNWLFTALQQQGHWCQCS